MARTVAKTVAHMTAEELRELVGSAVEQKLLQLLSDPDAGLVLRENVRKRLLRQKRAVAKGERGESIENVVRRLDIAARADAVEGIRQGLKDARRGTVRPAGQFFDKFEAEHGITR